MPDETIDTDDIPEVPDTATVDRRLTNLYRPVKHPVTIRLDADVIRWFKDHAEGRPYQSEINRVLREHVADAAKRGA
ncbi:MAG TPA: BrnA antitoxin family protein [Caulobacteraceae bacterium]